MIWFLIRLPTKNLITNPILAELPIRRRNKLHTLLYHEQTKKKKKKKDESFNKSHLLIDIIFASDNHLCFRTIPLEKLQKLILRNWCNIWDKKLQHDIHRAATKKKKWAWWIVFMVWLTDERSLVLFPGETIARDPHHRESPTRREQGLNLCRT